MILLTSSIFTEKILTDKKGWWNFVLPVDINNDGNIDLIAGNLGLNSRLKASADQPEPGRFPPRIRARHGGTAIVVSRPVGVAGKTEVTLIRAQWGSTFALVPNV